MSVTDRLQVLDLEMKRYPDVAECVVVRWFIEAVTLALPNCPGLEEHMAPYVEHMMVEIGESR